MKVPTIAAVRWGAREEINVPAAAGTVVDVAQFLDLKLLAPQQLTLALYAVTSAPIVGLSVDWILQLGGGSFSHTERTTVAVSDELAQLPLILLRAANSVQLSARITSVAGAGKLVKLVAFIAPTSPTWHTDLTCTVES
jgi:hypothetical protein